MKRTLGEWEKLWRESWDINNDADLDQLFAGTKEVQGTVCEVEIILSTLEGRIDTVLIVLLDEQGAILISHEYSIYELGRVELVLSVIASINNDPEDEDEA